MKTKTIIENNSLYAENRVMQIFKIIREVESTFKCLQSDLQIRPIHHQNDLRTVSHICLFWKDNSIYQASRSGFSIEKF